MTDSELGLPDAGQSFVEEYESRIGRELKVKEKGVLGEMVNTLCELAGGVISQNKEDIMAFMTYDDILNIVAERQDNTNCKYFFAYEDDEDNEMIQFHTNMIEAEDFDDMVEVFESTDAYQPKEDWE